MEKTPTGKGSINEDNGSKRWLSAQRSPWRRLASVAALAVIGAAALVAASFSTRETRAASSPFSGLNIMGWKMGVFADGGWALDINGNGVWEGCAIDRCLNFGSPGDKPVFGVWSAIDNQPSIGVYRPSTNEWFLDLNHNGFFDGCGVDRCISGFQTADAANIPVVGRWNDGDTVYKIGIFRNGTWFLDTNGDNAWNASSDTTAFLGQAGDLPVVGRWNSSFNHDTTGVFRAGSFFLDGNGNFNWDFDCGIDLCTSFGGAGDTPIAGAFDWFASPAVTGIGTFNSGTWRFDMNNNFAFDGCTTDNCASGFGGNPQIPIVGPWPAMQWATIGDRALSSTVAADFEPSAAVVPPGTNTACPNGAVFIAGQSQNIFKADLSCAADASCYTAFDLRTVMSSTDVLLGDAMTSWTPTNGLIHSHNTLRCVGVDCFVIALIFQSTNCGNSWAVKGAADSSSNIALNGQCAFRQATFNVPAVLRPSTGELFVDKNRNNVVDAGELVNSATLPADRFVRSGDLAVAGDWDGKGATRLGRFRDGQWVLDLDGNFVANCAVDACFTYGQSGDIPVVGRWNSTSPDLKHQIGVFRNGTWILDANGNRTQDAGDTTFGFGQAGDQPVVGDWKNTGLRGRNTRVGVFRTATAEWFLDQGAVGWQGCGTDICIGSRAFGDTNHKAVSGIIAQDPAYKDGIGTFVDGSWFFDGNDDNGWSGCGADQCFSFGLAGDVPLPGQWVSGPGGWDRPVMYSDPFNGMLYVFPRCDSRGGGDKSQLYFSGNGGTTWKAVRVPGGQWGSQMTSTNGGKLYLTDINGGSVKVWPATVNTSTQTVTVHAAQVVDSGVVSNLVPDNPNFGVARVGRNGNKDVFLAAFPHVFSLINRAPTEGLMVDRIEVVTTSTGITSMTKVGAALELVTDADFKSMIQPTFIEGPLGSNTTFVYWHELGDSRNFATSPVQVKGLLIRTLAAATGWTTSPVQLSRDAAGNPRSWTGFPASRGTGDYLTAASFGSPPQFFAQWTETPGGWFRHASIVGVLEP